jgi:selenocysteine lyase/cysteine desulfurase
MASLETTNSSDLLQYISENIIGKDLTFQSPFGVRKVLYADYTASGRSLRCIEDYIQEHVLPWYGNTHTLSSVTSSQVSHLREEARLIIRNAVNASEYDSVLFTGNGTTGAINLLIHAMELRPQSNTGDMPVVIHGPFEHHSNLLPWRQMGAEVVPVPETPSGDLDLVWLEKALQRFSGRGRVIIGTFSAASNITGVMTDTDRVTELLHKYGALSFWDYATAAPYVDMNMNPLHPGVDPTVRAKDAIFFSPHKFIGGVDSPGILVAKKKLFKSSSPYTAGGGTVFYVTPRDQLYLQEVESREEGGTPAIIGSIRAGLAMQLKESVGVSTIMTEENTIFRRVLESWGSVQEVVLLGPTHGHRLPVFSFLIRHDPSGRFLHHNYVCALLNDLFGIQSRGGCSCAGPYGQSLLGIDPELAEQYQKLLMEDRRLDREHLRRHNEYSEKELLRPGMTRLGFTYFMTEQEVDYIIEAVAMVAKHGWKLLPLYDINPDTGQFQHMKNRSFSDRKWLSNISYKKGRFECTSKTVSKSNEILSFKETLSYAQKLFEDVAAYSSDVMRSLGNQHSLLDDKCEEYRWFLYPKEAQEWLKGGNFPRTPPPFTPKLYSLISKDSVAQVVPSSTPTKAGTFADVTSPRGGIPLTSNAAVQKNCQGTEPSLKSEDPPTECSSTCVHTTCTSASLLDGSVCSGHSQLIRTRDVGTQCRLEVSSSVGRVGLFADDGREHLTAPQLASTLYDSSARNSLPRACSPCSAFLYSMNTMPTPLVETTPKSTTETTPTPVTEAIPSPVTEAIPTPVMETTPTLVTETTPTTSLETTPTLVTETTPTTSLETTPTLVTETTPTLVTETTPTPSLETTPTLVTETTSTMSLETTPSLVTETTPTLVTETTPTTSLETTPTLVTETTPTMSLETTPTPAAETTPTTSLETKPTPAAETSPSQSSLPAKQYKVRFYCPPKIIMKPALEALVEYSMIQDGDRVLVCLSGGKDSLSLLHALRQYQHYIRARGVEFELGAVTIDPKSSSYNPAPLIPYLKSLGIPYFYEEQGILEKALEVNCSSICSFCSRMKRGRLYSCARREGYNVLAFGQHLDDLAESFLMAIFHNGFLRTMKAHYTVKLVCTYLKVIVIRAECNSCKQSSVCIANRGV